jgi:hypothetical protein
MVIFQSDPLGDALAIHKVVAGFCQTLVIVPLVDAHRF